MKKSTKEIGGYFSLEINQLYDNIGDDLALNSATNCLRYLIRKEKIIKLYVPNFICPSVKIALENENCSIIYYDIDSNFVPKTKFKENDYILYTNYFGIFSKNVKQLAKTYKNLIVDNAQAFFMPPYGFASIYSIRKFFGIPDGAIIRFREKNFSYDNNLDIDISYSNCSHLLKRMDVDAKIGYNDFRLNEQIIENKSVKIISNLSKKLFNSINIEQTKQKRLENFYFLHTKLKQSNKFIFELSNDDAPLFYPYIIANSKSLKQYLIKNNIFIPTYWNDNYKDDFASYLRDNLIPLPIDQRYNLDDMKFIIDIIKEFCKNE